ncbi:MAG TPA: hypothetical protein VD864_00135 [Nocardioides sp.]|nr:hypothetical protein [Nocardioides sp.]
MASGPTWGDVLERWALIECDLHDVYGVDVGDEAVMTGRTWPWLRLRILGLLTTDCRLSRALMPRPAGH